MKVWDDEYVAQREVQEAEHKQLTKTKALRLEEAEAIKQRVKIVQTHEQVARKVMTEKIETIQSDYDTLMEGAQEIELKHLQLID